MPWEIGVATEKERFLASYVSDTATVPDYLIKWPYLRTQADLDAYIRESKKAQLLVESGLQTGSTFRQAARRQGFRSFHTSLKSSLGQR